jgi:hypothetical protein
VFFEKVFEVLSVCNWFAKILHEIGAGTRGRGVARRSTLWQLASIGMSLDESRSTIDSLTIGVDLNDVSSVAQFAKEMMRDERLNTGRR